MSLNRIFKKIPSILNIVHIIVPFVHFKCEPLKISSYLNFLHQNLKVLLITYTLTFVRFRNFKYFLLPLKYTFSKIQVYLTSSKQQIPWCKIIWLYHLVLFVKSLHWFPKNDPHAKLQSSSSSQTLRNNAITLITFRMLYSFVPFVLFLLLKYELPRKVRFILPFFS